MVIMTITLIKIKILMMIMYGGYGDNNHYAWQEIIMIMMIIMMT